MKRNEKKTRDWKIFEDTMVWECAKGHWSRDSLIATRLPGVTCPLCGGPMEPGTKSLEGLRTAIYDDFGWNNSKFRKMVKKGKEGEQFEEDMRYNFRALGLRAPKAGNEGD